MNCTQPVVFITNHRVKFTDIDPYGHLNTNYFISYFIEHRFQGLREVLGLDLKTLSALPIVFYTSKISVEFKKPLYGDEVFSIESATDCFDDYTVLVKGVMKKVNGTVAAIYELRLVCVDKANNRPISWPPEIVKMFFEDTSPKERKPILESL